MVSARIDGLKESTGNYIAFVDADDWVDREFYTDFVRRMDEDQGIDLCIGGMVRNLPNGNVEQLCVRGQDRKFEICEALREMFSFRLYRWELCGKIYKRELFSKMPDMNIRSCEDLDWNWDLFQCARNVWYSGKYSYHYFLNTNSVTQSKTVVPNNAIEVFRRIWKEYEGSDNLIKETIFSNYVKQILYQIRWLLLKDFRQPRHREQIEAYCEEFKRTFSEAGQSGHIPGYPDGRLVRAMCQGYQEISRLFFGYFRSLSKKLRAFCQNHDIYIYGAGRIAKYIAEILLAFDVKFSSYVISDNRGDFSRNADDSIKLFSDVSLGNKNNVFLLSMLEKWQKEIQVRMDSEHFLYVKVDTRLLGFE